MKNKKSVIDTYETVYSIDLVVANKYATLEQLKKLYVYSDGVELDDEVMQADATTSTIKRKSDGKYCILVKHNRDCSYKKDKKVDLINTISHEAGHVVLDIYEFIHQNVCNCSSEPFCYLLGWVSECIYKNLTKK